MENEKKTAEAEKIAMPKKDVSPDEPAKEEDYGVSKAGKPSKDLTRIELCEMIRDLVAEKERLIIALGKQNIRVELLREEIDRFMNSDIRGRVMAALNEALTSLGIKIGK